MKLLGCLTLLLGLGVSHAGTVECGAVYCWKGSMHLLLSNNPAIKPQSRGKTFIKIGLTTWREDKKCTDGEANAHVDHRMDDYRFNLVGSLAVNAHVLVDVPEDTMRYKYRYAPASPATTREAEHAAHESANSHMSNSAGVWGPLFDNGWRGTTEVFEATGDTWDDLCEGAIAAARKVF